MADHVDAPVQMSRLAQIRENEPHWIWKASIRAFLCVIDIVAIGCAAWLVAKATNSDSYDSLVGYWDLPGASAGSLAVLCLAFIWCTVLLAIPFLLKPPKPTHPGWAVGGDLLLWIGFVLVGLLSIGGIFSVISFGSGGVISDPSYYHSAYNGEYILAPNNTWVYNITSVYSNSPGYYNYTTGGYEYPTPSTKNVTRDCTPDFTSCAQQDAYVNKLWHEKSRFEGTTYVVAVVEWLGVLMHFILFVWACVDTHRYNAKKRIGTDQIVADRIIQDLEKRGLIQVKNGVVVSSGGAPSSSTNHPATEPLLATGQPAAHQSSDAITPL